ncbi:unnamed protein product, partial [Prorocentrum cordatum]
GAPSGSRLGQPTRGQPELTTSAAPRRYVYTEQRRHERRGPERAGAQRPWTREAPHFITFASTAFISGVAKEKGQYTARWLWRAAEAAVRDLRAHELTKLTAACGAYNLAESCSAGLGCAGGACASADAAAGAAGLVLADAALVAVPAAAAGAAGAALAMAAWGRRGAGPQQVWPAA